MNTFDWIVVGNGLAGAALSYELVRQGQSVLLIDDENPDSATRYSYGGIAYWSGTTDLTKQLFQDGIARHRSLSAELDTETDFREIDLLLTVPQDKDPDSLAQQYSTFEISPQLISVPEACELEPQLDPVAIAGALTVKHGHVTPIKVVAGFNQAFRRLGGQHFVAQVTGLVRVGNRVTGVMTATQAYAAGQVAIATGGYTRSLLRAVNVSVPLYHTHAEIVAVPPLEAKLRTLIMAADADRFEAEDKATQSAVEPLWDEPDCEILPPILDAGAIQFIDQSLFIGQVSHFHSAVEIDVDAVASAAKMQQAIAQQLPFLTSVTGTWHRCLVSFSRDGLPLVGPVPGIDGIHVFSGFTSPFAMLLPIAQRFAAWSQGQSDEVIDQMLVSRFSTL